jgi:hypothetical protein
LGQITLGSGGGDGQALPASTLNAALALPDGGARTAHPTGSSGGVEEPSLREEMNDDLPF